MELFRLLAGRRTIYSPSNQQNSKWSAGRVAIGLLIGLTAIQMVGCKQHSTGPTAEIRFVDTIPDADAVKVTVKGSTAFDDTPFGAFSDYQQVVPGAYTVSATAKRHGARFGEIAPLHYNIEQDHRYTGIAIGNADSDPKARLLVLDDDWDPTSIPPGDALVRIVDAYPHDSKLDITVNNIVTFSGLSYGSRCKAVRLPAKSYVYKAIKDDSWSDPVAGPTDIELKSGKSYQLIVTGPSTGHDTGFILLTDK